MQRWGFKKTVGLGAAAGILGGIDAMSKGAGPLALVGGAGGGLFVSLLALAIQHMIVEREEQKQKRP